MSNHRIETAGANIIRRGTPPRYSWPVRILGSIFWAINRVKFWTYLATHPNEWRS